MHTIDCLFFYLLQQRNCGLVEKDVKTGDEAKPPSKRCVKCDNLRFWWNVKSLLKVKVLFMVPCHQQTI